MRFPEEGTEFSTVSHPEKKLKGGENSLPLRGYTGGGVGGWRRKAGQIGFQGCRGLGLAQGWGERSWPFGDQLSAGQGANLILDPQ